MSEVTICNLALSHIGDTATVASIKPPDSSLQAQLCARFFYVARNALLEMANWGFATRRVALAMVDNPTLDLAEAADPTATRGTWRYAYALPNAVINVLGVLSAEAADDYCENFGLAEQDCFHLFRQGWQPLPAGGNYTPQPYSIESAADGSQIVLTNVENAVMRYTTLVQDTTKFSPLFMLALSYLLASMLAGPIIKGDAGAAMATQMLQLFGSFKAQAVASDANQRKANVEPVVSWIRGR